MKYRSRARVSTGLFLFLLLSVPAAAQISDVYVIPAAANTPGALNTYWATSFFIMNPQGHDLTVTLTFVPAGGEPGLTFDFDIGANQTLYGMNILGEDGFGVTNAAGSLLVAVFPEKNPTLPDEITARAFVVQTRTYNVLGSGATVGQGIRGAITGLVDFDLDGISAIAPGVLSEGTSGDFRTNVGAVNLSDFSATLNVTVWDVNGNSLGTFPLQLPPTGFVQDPLPIATDQPVSLEFVVQFPAGVSPGFTDLIFPFASVIDNDTGDPTYYDPTLLATPATIAPFKTQSAAATPQRVRLEGVRDIVQESKYLGHAWLEREADGTSRLVLPAR
ncbi:MAG: hypothetical protein ACRD2J_03110 [Thermoanaerobaculia bacterium]